VRKAILARLIVHEALDPVLSRGGEQAAYLVAEEAIDAVRTATRLELAAPLAERLDDFVQGLVGGTADKIVGNKRLVGDATLDPAVTAMRLQAASISCVTCAAGATPCDGGSSSHDDALVESAGLCIEPFRVLFQLAVDIVRTSFEFALGAEILKKWPRTRFGTGYVSGKKAHVFGASAQVTGATLRSNDQTTIELIFCPAEFTWSAYLAAGYVLVHEALHVMEAIDSSRTSIPTKNEEDPFLEGWMDWIAFQLFSFTTLGRGVAKPLARFLRYPSAQRERSRELHESRFNAETSGKKALSYRLLSGKRAAETLFNFIRQHLPREQSQKLFLAISFRIDMQELSLARHVKLVARVNDDLPPAGASEVLNESARELGRAIRSDDIEMAISWLLG
jgi:hypothetical protein